MNKYKTIYLASPYGFSTQQKARCLPEIKKAIESLGIIVWEPFERNNQVDWGLLDTPFLVGMQDRKDVLQADAIFAVINGTPPDEGVMIELGMAIALDKPTFLFRDDFRRCTDTEKYPLNLMIFQGLPKDGWRDYYYQSVAEIVDPTRALSRWSSNRLPGWLS